MSGLGSFIQGAFSGYEFGEQVKDRKTTRKRNEKRWEWEKESQDWRREDRGWTKENRDWTRTTRGRQEDEWARQEAEREAFSDAYDSARDTWNDTQQAPPEPTTGQDQQEAPQRDQEAAPAARQRAVMPDDPTRPQARPPKSVISQPAVADRGPSQPAQPSPEAPPAPQAPASVEGATPQQVQPQQTQQPGRTVRGVDGAVDTGQDAPMPRSFAENQRAQQVAAEQQVSVDQLWQVMRPEDKQLFTEMDGQPTPTPPQVRPQSDASARPQQRIPQPQAPSAPQGGGAPQSGAQQAPAPRNAGEVGAGNRPAQGENAPQASQAAPARPGAPGAAPAVGNMDVRNASTEELDRQATENPPDQGGAPSVESASDAVRETAESSKGVVGPDTGRVNPRDEKRASDNFLQHYAENAVPKIVDYYLSQGDVEKAQAFQEWSDSQQVKGQMESWSKAVWAITNGDEDRFIDHIADTYNSIDDGFTIDRSKTKLTRDKQGNIVGGQLAVVNDETGETNIQQFDDQQDIIEMAVYAMAPEQTFEYLWGLSQQAREMRINQAAKQNESIDPVKMQNMIGTEARSIRKIQSDPLYEDEKIPEDQIEAEARRRVLERMGYSTGSSSGQTSGANAQEPPPL